MSRLARTILIAAFLGMLAVPGGAAAQQQKVTAYPYTAIDLGTLGGPSAYTSLPGQIVTNGGRVLVEADTTTPDPDYTSMVGLLTGNNSTNVEPSISHAAVWRNGELTDLGALPGNNNSEPFQMNAAGEIVGASENGINPTMGYPETRAVAWKDGRITDLGTLGGYESFAFSINDRGQVVGFASNAVPDPFTLGGYPVGTQIRAFLWQNGRMQDLGTLGGPDSIALSVSDRGQIAGQSFTNATVNPISGIPTLHPFLWQDGRMRDLGTLGGTFAYGGDGRDLNIRGEVIGASALKGDLVFHPFLWDGTKIMDLGTFGGNYGQANDINQAGDVAGWAQTTATSNAFLWTKGKGLQDLGSLPSQPCSFAESINARDQVVGGSCNSGDTGDGWLWSHGALYDLNALVAPSPSGMQLRQGNTINDRGEIAAIGVLPNGDKRVVLLVPKGVAQSERLTAVTRSDPAAVTQGSASVIRRGPSASKMVAPFGARLTQRYHLRVR